MHHYAKQHSEISMPSGVNPVSTTYVRDLWFRNKEAPNQQLQVSDEPKRGRGHLKGSIIVVCCRMFHSVSQKKCLLIVVCHHWKPKVELAERKQKVNDSPQ